MWILIFTFWLGTLADGVELWTVNQGQFRAEFEGIDAQRCTVRVGGVKQEIPNEEIITLKFSDKKKDKKAPAAIVELVNGDQFKGTVKGGNQDRLQLESSSLGSVELRIDFLKKFILPRQANTEDLSFFSTTEGKDRVYRKVSGTVDFIDGSFEGFDSAKVIFRSAIGLEQNSLDDVAALVLTPLEAYKEKKELLAIVEFTDGSRLTCELLGMPSGKLELQSPALGKLSVEVKNIAGIRFKNGRYFFLSDLEPSKVEESTPFGGSDTVLFHYRKDLSVSGKPLRVGGAEFTKGLGVHSKAALSYKLAKKYKAFRASVGVDDEVLNFPSKGSVIFRIFADGKKTYESPVVRGGMNAIAVPEIDLKGVEELTLEVDYADELHVADRADWIEPLLIQ